MDSKTIMRLIVAGESDAVEFKRARGGVPADFWPSYSSFANTDGGVIVLGVRENEKHEREIEGLADVEKIKADLWNAANNPDKVSANVLNIFSLVRIGERSGMGISSLYGVWKQEKFAQPSIAESYEPDRTKVTVEYESEAAEVGVKTSEVKEKTAEVGVETSEVGVKTPEVREKAAELGVETSEVGVEIAGANNAEAREFDVLMGAYRNDFRENARRVLTALAKNPEMDFGQVSKAVNISENSVWRAVRALREIGLLVREGANKGGRWIVKQAGK